MNLLAIDLLRRNGEWCVIDINANPSGLAEADTLSKLYPPNAVRSVAQALFHDSGGKPVCIVLPDWCNVPRGITEYSLETRSGLIDEMLSLSLRDVNLVASSVRELGSRCYLTNSCLLTSPEHSRHYQKFFGVVWNRSHHQLGEIGFTEANDIRVREVCREKSSLSGALSDSKVLPLRTISVKNKQPSELLDHRWLIIKPERGFGSFGIVRLRPMELIDRFDEFSLAPMKYGWQPWIRPPDFLDPNGHRYFYDVRAFLLDGRVIGVLARQAVAPAQGISSASPLSWLTPLGRTRSIHEESDKSEFNPKVSMAQLCQLENLCVELNSKILAIAKKSDSHLASNSYFSKSVPLGVPSGFIHYLAEMVP